MASPSRSSGDEDLDVRLEWPEDDLLEEPTPKGRSGRRRAKSNADRAITVGGAPRARAALPAVRTPPPADLSPARAVDVLSKRIDALTAHVAALTDAVQGDADQKLDAVGDLRDRLRVELKSLDQAVDVVRELREGVAASLADRDERQVELGSVMADLVKEVRSMRRAIAVPSKTQAAKREREQAKAIAESVVAALRDGGTNGTAARASRRRG